MMEEMAGAAPPFFCVHLYWKFTQTSEFLQSFHRLIRTFVHYNGVIGKTRRTEAFIYVKQSAMLDGAGAIMLAELLFAFVNRLDALLTNRRLGKGKAAHEL
ncbi:hypothetical protein [Paenibacillus cymbidii]|uniref:hypothetical protein n=1 Tax=Paenibacillus cymbidii TaxID=1639034 RepID=UPI001081B283|nr:hypothetical protein [Paenibacillus cymbidii]